MRYVDPDGREEYDSSMTEEQFKKIANGIVVTQDGFKATLNGKTWDETQKFFLDNPEGVIYRNPDEFGYNFYTNQGNDIPHEYNMYTTDLVDIFLIGRGLSKIIGSCISYAGKKSLSKGLQHHILSRHSLNGLRSQYGKASIQKLLNKTIFNPSWSDSKILKASKKVIELAIKNGVTDGTFTATVYGETITAAFENGVPKTVYGVIVVTEEMLK